MVHYKFNQTEIINIWKHCKNKRYEIKSFKNRGGYVKYVMFDDKQNGGCASGKVVTRFTEGEVYHWPRLRHRSLAPLLDVIYIDERIAIYMSSYLPKTLRELIHNENFINDPQCFDRKKSYTEDVLVGLSYLHSKHLCLMNVSDVNVLITQAENRAVVANFTCLSMFHNAYKHKRCAPLMYRAPELSTASIDNIIDPTYSDIWSVGVMIMEVFLNRMCPWGSVDYDSNQALDLSTRIDYEMLKIANRGSVLTSRDVLDFKQFLSLFLDLNPKSRCSAKEASLKKFIQSSTYRIHIKKLSLSNKKTKSDDSISCEKLTAHSGSMSNYSHCQLRNKSFHSETNLRYLSNLQIDLSETQQSHESPSVKKNCLEKHIGKPHFEVKNSKLNILDLQKFTELANKNEFGKNINKTCEFYSETHEDPSEISANKQDKTFPQHLNSKVGSDKMQPIKRINFTSGTEDSKLKPSFKSLSPNIFKDSQLSRPFHCSLPSSEKRKFSRIMNTKNNPFQQLGDVIPLESLGQEKIAPHATKRTKSAPRENTFKISPFSNKMKNISSLNSNKGKKVTSICNENINKTHCLPESATNKLLNTNDTWKTNGRENDIMTSTKTFSSLNNRKNNHWEQFFKTMTSEAFFQQKVVSNKIGSPKSVTKESTTLNISPFSDISKTTNFKPSKDQRQKVVFPGSSPDDSVWRNVEDHGKKSTGRQMKDTTDKEKCAQLGRHSRSRKNENRSVTTLIDNRDKLSSKQKCQMTKFLLNNVNIDSNDGNDDFETESITDLSNRRATFKSLKQKTTNSGVDNSTHKGHKKNKFLCFGKI